MNTRYINSHSNIVGIKILIIFVNQLFRKSETITTELCTKVGNLNFRDEKWATQERVRERKKPFNRKLNGWDVIASISIFDTDRTILRAGLNYFT